MIMEKEKRRKIILKKIVVWKAKSYYNGISEDTKHMSTLEPLVTV